MITSLVAASILYTQPIAALASGPAPARDVESTGARADKSLQVVVGENMVGRERTRTWVEERAAQVVSESGTPSPNSEWTIRIEVDGIAQAYQVGVTAQRGQDRVGSSELAACPCDADQMLDTVGAQLRKVLAEIDELEKTEDAQPTPPIAGVAGDHRDSSVLMSSSTQPASPPPPPDRGGIGGLGIAGIIVGVAGGAVAGYGIERAVRREELPAVNQGREVLRFRSRGTDAAIGIGATAFAAGFTMLMVDLFYCRKRPSGCRQKSHHLSSGFSGMTIQF